MNVNDVKLTLRFIANDPECEVAEAAQDALEAIVSLQEMIKLAADALAIVTAVSSDLSLDTSALCLRVADRCREWT